MRLRILILLTFGLSRLAHGQSLSGQSYLLTDSLNDKCKVVANCDCCATDLIFLTDKTFLMVDNCIYDDSYYTGTYSRTQTKVTLTFKQVTVHDIFDEVTKKSRNEKRSANIKPIEFSIKICGTNKTMLEHPTIKQLKHGERQATIKEKELIRKLKASKEWKMLAD